MRKPFVRFVGLQALRAALLLGVTFGFTGCPIELKECSQPGDCSEDEVCDLVARLCINADDPSAPPTLVAATWNAQVGKSWNETLTVSGGEAPYSWSLEDLPSTLSWLKLDANSGVLSGTPTVAVSDAPFRVSVKDARSRSAAATFTITVAPQENPCALDPQACAGEVQVWGVVANWDDGLLFQGEVKVGEQPVSEATVRLDEMSFGVTSGQFYHYDQNGGSLAPPGSLHQIELIIPGREPLYFDVTLPGEYTILSPSQGDVLPVHQSMTAQWTDSANAEEYWASLYVEGEELFSSIGSSQGWTSVGPVQKSGSATLLVQTILGQEQPFAGIVLRSVAFSFQ